MSERVIKSGIFARNLACSPLLSVKASRLLHVFSALALLGGGLVIYAAAAQLPPAPPAAPEQEGIETLVQGAMHEAFANPADGNPTAGPIINKQPPQDVNEEPPEFMPEGAIWIVGYWIWDEERDDFVWVTGVARKPPPGMRFVPSYWTQVEGGFQRVPGFWVSTNASEIEYREAPPESLDIGPSSPAPADNYFWVPGSWNYYTTGYRWRGGYWSPYQPNWIWCPARWVWTPAGYVYTAGFWDFEMQLRGQIFAPVYFRTAYYRQPGYSYRPWCVIPTTNLFIHLWVRPGNCHYYYGNYYGSQYANYGLRSWCNSPGQRYQYDPFYNYARVHYRRQGIDYIGRCQNWHDYYVRNVDHRPSRTWREQQEHHGDHRHDRNDGRNDGRNDDRRDGRDRDGRDNDRQDWQTQFLARNLDDVAKRDDGPVRLTKLDSVSRQALVERAEKLREFNVTRKKVELDAAQVALRTPGGENAARERLDSLRDAAREGRDLASGKGVDGKADDRDNARGKGEDRSKRSSLDRIEDLAKAGKGGEGRLTTGTTARLTLPKVEGIISAKVERSSASDGKQGTGKQSSGKSMASRRDSIPPPIAAVDNGSKTAEGSVGNERDTRPADSVRRSGRVELNDPDRPVVDASSQPAILPAEATKLPSNSGKNRVGRGSDPTLNDLPEGKLPRASDTVDESRNEKGKGERSRGKAPLNVPPAIENPDVDLPKVERPKVERTKVELPKAAPPVETLPLDLPKVDAPKLERTKAKGKRQEAPPMELPKVDLPKIEAPKVETRRVETPKVDAPKVEKPKFENRRFEAPKVESRRNDAPKNDAPKLDLPKIDMNRRQQGNASESPAPMPRVEPRAETRSMPRVEAPRVERSMPRVEVPRETRPAPRVESPRVESPRIETPSASRAAPPVERSNPSPRAAAPSDSGSRSYTPPGRGDRFKQKDD